MTVPARGVLALLLAALLLAFVAGCGSQNNGVGSKSPAEILDAATAAAQAASAVHLQASSSAGGLMLVMSMRYTKEGARGQVTLLGLSFELIRIGNSLYVRGNRAFDRRLGEMLGGRTGAAVAAKLPSGTWLQGAAGAGPVKQLAAFTDMDQELALILGHRTPVGKGAERTMGGQKTIELKQAGRLYTGALYIATIGNPYPILQRKTGQETGQTSFTEWNKPVTLTAPTPALDVNQLAGEKGQ